MQKKPTISVLMSVFNTKIELIERAINSVLKQDYKNFELIIIDDGSDLETGKKILEIAVKHQDMISYYRHPNCGQSKSINIGVKLSLGKYLTIIDSDDEYKPNHLSLCLNEMENSDLIASNTETIIECEDDLYLPDKHDLTKKIHVDDCILFATLFGKKKVFKKINFVGIYGADSDFYELASKFFVVNKLDLRTYIYYRNIPNSVTFKKKLNLQIQKNG